MKMIDPETPDRLSFEAVTVDFGATRALSEITASIQPGEIVGLLGHNGAGKTTLFNVASGSAPATSGRFLLDGRRVPRKAIPSQIAALGITIIHQEPALAGNLSVIDNIQLGRPSTEGRAAGRLLAQAALDKVGAHADLDQPVSALGLGQRQLVDLARGITGGEMKVLLLDEPTAALGRAETDALHALIRTFAAAGTAVVYVSHRLPDILEVCQRILVLRAGELVLDRAASEFTPRELASALAPGIDHNEFYEPTAGEDRFALTSPYPLSFRAGEVVGLFGMAAGDQFTVLERMFGLGAPVTVTLDGNDQTISSPNQCLGLGIHLVPADRERDGLISGMSAVDNVYLPWLRNTGGRGWWITTSTGQDAYRESRSNLSILGPGGDMAIDQFSGGNRQKHLLARWMFPVRPRVLLLAQPTQGVDVGARADIRRGIRAAAGAGTTVIVASSETDEITSLCDRSYVLLGDQFAHVDTSSAFDGILLETLLSLAERSAAGQSNLAKDGHD
jgi:ABC-type sugar transport system ATPase subunit